MIDGIFNIISVISWWPVHLSMLSWKFFNKSTYTQPMELQGPHIQVNPFPNKPWFVCVCSMSLLKTMWEKKLLATSNFSFSHIVFYPFQKLSAIFIKFEIVVCKFFQFGRVKFVFWERVKNPSNNYLVSMKP